MINSVQNTIDNIQQVLEQFAETEFALLITAGKDKEGYKRDGLVLVGRLDKAIVTTAFNMTDEKDLETVIIGAASMYLSHREQLREVAERNSKLVKL